MERPTRRPLLIRGARQVGKTTLIDAFSSEFDHYLPFNLEIPAHKRLFERYNSIDELVQLLFLEKGKILQKDQRNLIFIDEIQEYPEAINMLRYFFENYPFLYVIASGSLVEHALGSAIKIPVGRIEYAVLHPVNFQEYMEGAGYLPALDYYLQMPIPDLAVEKLFDYFHEYVIIGGMPSVVKSYIEHQDITQLKELYDNLLTTYSEDVEKYADSRTMQEVIRHVIKTAPFYVDQRITFAQFGGSSYKSREVGEAMRALEKARVIDLIYPTTAVTPPAVPNYNKSPRLQFLDTGLLNSTLQNQAKLLQLNDLNDAARGRIVQHIVYQELQSIHYSISYKNIFWVREKHTASAEVDILYPFEDKLVPIEVKSGPAGKLRSLNEFMDRCNHDLAIRLYRGKVNIDHITTPNGKAFRLLNLPYFLAARIPEYIRWMERGTDN